MCLLFNSSGSFVVFLSHLLKLQFNNLLFEGIRLILSFHVAFLCALLLSTAKNKTTTLTRNDPIHVILIHSSQNVYSLRLVQLTLPHNDALVVKFSLRCLHDGILLTRHLPQRQVGQALGHMIHDTRQQFGGRQKRQRTNSILNSLRRERDAQCQS